MENTQIVIISILSGTTTYFLLQWLNERNYRKLDKALYPKLASDLANNLSEVVYTNRNNIPKRWFDKIVNFLDYMADDGYINTDNRDEKRRIEQEYNMLAK